jgi:hypothetical protein
MPKPTPHLVARMEERLLQIQREHDHKFPEFFQVARRALPDRSDEIRFPFVVYSLWRERGRGRSWDWVGLIAEAYTEIEESFDWEPTEKPEWVDQQLIEKTLSVWQPRYPKKLSARSAVEILLNSTDPAVVSGGAA